MIIKVPKLLNTPKEYRSEYGMRRFIQAIVNTFLVVGFLIFVIPVQAQENVAYVLSIEGNWYLSGSNQPIQRWQKLPGGGRVVAGKPITKSSYITIALFNGDTIHRKCSGSKTCKPSISIPMTGRTGTSRQSSVGASTRQEKPSLKALIGKVFKDLFERPKTYMVPTLAGRSAEGSETIVSFQEAVISWNSGQANLSPVFKNMPAGSYSLTAVPQSINSQSTNPSDYILIDIDWNPEQSATANTDKLQPGLYRLILERSSEAWILVVPDEKYEAAKDSFKQAVETTRQWGSQVDPETTQMFLRAYLENLSKAN